MKTKPTSLTKDKGFAIMQEWSQELLDVLDLDWVQCRPPIISNYHTVIVKVPGWRNPVALMYYRWFIHPQRTPQFLIKAHAFCDGKVMFTEEELYEVLKERTDWLIKQMKLNNLTK